LQRRYHRLATTAAFLLLALVSTCRGCYYAALANKAFRSYALYAAVVSYDATCGLGLGRDGSERAVGICRLFYRTFCLLHTIFFTCTIRAWVLGNNPLCCCYVCTVLPFCRRCCAVALQTFHAYYITYHLLPHFLPSVYPHRCLSGRSRLLVCSVGLWFRTVLVAAVLPLHLCVLHAYLPKFLLDYSEFCPAVLAVPGPCAFCP